MTRRGQQRGVSLIEAVVALAVMAFGMLGLVGVQATLRANADIAKQRSEAVRIAQEAMEDWRAFALLVPTDAVTDYADLVTDEDPTSIVGINASYSRMRTVTESTAPRMKTLAIEVTWANRAGLPEGVRLLSTVARIAPELGGSLSVPPSGTPTRRPFDRSTAIPVSAKSLGNGTSAFKPPQPAGGTVAWVFNNVTGLFNVCGTTAAGTADLTLANITGCGVDVAQLLSGYVRFAVAIAQPTAGVAESPPAGQALNLDISVSLTSAAHPAPGATCFDDAPETLAAAGSYTAVAYYCAITANPARTWSGISTLVPRAFTDGGLPWTIAASDDAHRKVCRYTPAVNDAESVANALHPRNYANVVGALTGQNFLVISAAHACPTDVANAPYDPADPMASSFVNSNTLVHQPAP